MLHRMFQRIIVAAAALLLAACAGTIQRETNAGSRKIDGATYTGVNIVLTDSARRMQADNPQFSVRELGDYVRRRLESTDLLNPQGTHRVEVTIDNFRVRSAAAAVLFGIMAGTDSIDGYVRVYDAGGRQVHGYKVNASYGLGGWGGGQDGMRMNWLYDKFSELTVAELAGATQQSSISKNRPAGAPRPSTGVSITAGDSTQQVTVPAAGGARTAAAIAPSATVAPAPAAAPRTAAAAPAAAPAPAQRTDTGYAPLDDVDAIPYLSDRGRNGYREYLTRPTPKAFAISSNGFWAVAWSLRPQDTTMPTDPSERALLNCERAAKMPCKLYAVNGAVVWTKDPK